MNNIYVSTTNGVNGADVPHINGRGIRRRKLSRGQRVGLAADLASGQIQFEPSLSQACELLNVPPARVREELKARAADREVQPMMNFVEAWERASEDQREAAIRAIGVAEVWDVLASVVA